MSKKTTPGTDLDLAAELYRQHQALDPMRRCSFQEWVRLKLTCSNARAGQIAEASRLHHGGTYPELNEASR